MTAPINAKRQPPYKVAGLLLAILAIVVLILVYLQFRGDFLSRIQLTMVTPRSGLSMDPGAKVTYNGVEIGRVGQVELINVGGEPKARIVLDVDPKYLGLIPENVHAEIGATTVFGNKYVSFTSPKRPVAQRVSTSEVIDVKNVTTEFNTLFETIVSVTREVDPIKLNQTLTATAQALDGLGDKFGQSILNGNQILGEINPQMPQIRRDNRLLADLNEIYANAAPNLLDGLNYAVTTAKTLNRQQADVDQALMAAVGFGNTGGDIFERGGPYLVRAASDLIPATEVLDRNSPALFCTVRNFHDIAPKAADVLGGNGYSLKTVTALSGAQNPYVYPDNLPRVNARGGPEGRPGCWQPITRDLWPAPMLVMDIGASPAPYNHFELGQPLVNEYVWGRQGGENTINP